MLTKKCKDRSLGIGLISINICILLLDLYESILTIWSLIPLFFLFIGLFYVIPVIKHNKTERKLNALYKTKLEDLQSSFDLNKYEDLSRKVPYSMKVDYNNLANDLICIFCLSLLLAIYTYSKSIQFSYFGYHLDTLLGAATIFDIFYFWYIPAHNSRIENKRVLEAYAKGILTEAIIIDIQSCYHNTKTYDSRGNEVTSSRRKRMSDFESTCRTKTCDITFYRCICVGYNPVTGKSCIFKSDYLRDCNENLLNTRVPVCINRKHPKYYYVDVVE